MGAAASNAKNMLYGDGELCNVELDGFEKINVSIYYLASPFAIYKPKGDLSKESQVYDKDDENYDNFTIRAESTEKSSVCQKIAEKITKRLAKAGLIVIDSTELKKQFRQIIQKKAFESDPSQKTFPNTNLLEQYDSLPQLLSFKQETVTDKDGDKKNANLSVYMRPPGGYLDSELMKISEIVKIKNTGYVGLRDMAEAVVTLSKIDAYVINNSDEIQQAYRSDKIIPGPNNSIYNILKNATMDAYYKAASPSNAVKSGISKGAKLLGAAAGLVGVGTLFRVIPRIMKVRNNIKKVWESISDKDEQQLTEHLCGSYGSENRAKLKNYLKLAFQGATDSLITLSQEKGDEDDGGSYDGEEAEEGSDDGTALVTEEEPTSDDEEGEFAAAA